MTSKDQCRVCIFRYEGLGEDLFKHAADMFLRINL